MRNSPNFNHHQTSTNITKNSNINNDSNQHLHDNNQYQTAAILTVAGIASIVAGFAKMTKNHKTILEQFKVLDELCETEKNEK